MLPPGAVLLAESVIWGGSAARTVNGPGSRRVGTMLLSRVLSTQMLYCWFTWLAVPGQSKAASKLPPLVVALTSSEIRLLAAQTLGSPFTSPGASARVYFLSGKAKLEPCTWACSP